jgi:hypothetical protein
MEHWNDGIMGPVRTWVTLLGQDMGIMGVMGMMRHIKKFLLLDAFRRFEKAGATWRTGMME